MPFFDNSRGTIIFYEEAGKGPPVVLLHGWAMSGRVWRFQRELADTFRLIEIDLRGHGKSPVPEEEFGLADLADDLAGLFEYLDLHDALVLGWSMGSQLAMKAFPALAGRVRGIVLVGGTPKFASGGDYDAGLPLREVQGLVVRLKRDYDRTMGEFFRRMFAPGEMTREQENRVAREIVMGSRLPDPAVARQGLAILAQEDLRDSIPVITCPVLLIHGEEDTICPPTASRFLATRLPDARLKVLAGMGHAPFLSHPGHFNELIVEFMRELHGSN